MFFNRLDYEATAQQPWYQAGLRRLLKTAEHGATVMMCSEEDPRRCHHHRLIEQSLRERGVVALHIRRDGALQTIDPNEAARPDVPSPQLALIGFNG